jgi:alanyl-tRNA synthetase
VSSEELHKVEQIVNRWILQDLKVICREMSKSDAITSGATALFGEKYGDRVRTVSILDGNQHDEKIEKTPVSFELCGGTHAASTGRIGLFKILSEVSIGSGIRRIEALTGEKVLEYIKQIEEIISLSSEALKCCRSEVVKKIDDILIELKQKNQEILKWKQRSALEKVQEFTEHGVPVYSLIVSDHSIDELRSLNEAIRIQKNSGIIIVANYTTATTENKISLMVSVGGSDLQNKYHAGQLLKCGLASINGKGGGNAAFAQGGGAGGQKQIYDAIETIKNFLIS